MAKYRKRPVIVNAVQWFKMGDHPEVHLSDVGITERVVVPCLWRLRGVQRVQPGEWIVETPGGPDRCVLLTDKAFRAAYEEVIE